MQGRGHTIRRCFTVYRPGEADAASAAALFMTAAAKLEALGHVQVHHVALDIVDDSRRSELSLTVYFDGE